MIIIYACLVLSCLSICHTSVELNGVFLENLCVTPFKSSEVLGVCLGLCLCPFSLVELTTNDYS